MLTTLLITVIILVICVVLLSVKVIFKKGGKFPNTHIEGNAALRKKGICCAKTQHKRDSLRKNLYDKIKEIEEECLDINRHIKEKWFLDENRQVGFFAKKLAELSDMK